MRLLVFQQIMSAVERLTFGNDRRTGESELRVDRDLQRGRENGVLLLPCLVVEIESRDRVIQFLPLQPRLDGVVHVVAGEKFLVDDLVDVLEGGHRRAGVLVDLVGLRLVLPAAPLKIGAHRRADDAGGQDEAADLAEPELRWLFRGLFRDLGSLSVGHRRILGRPCFRCGQRIPGGAAACQALPPIALPGKPPYRVSNRVSGRRCPLGRWVIDL